jgi:hypothetical protein
MPGLQPVEAKWCKRDTCSHAPDNNIDTGEDWCLVSGLRLLLQQADELTD